MNYYIKLSIAVQSQASVKRKNTQVKNLADKLVMLRIDPMTNSIVGRNDVPYITYNRSWRIAIPNTHYFPDDLREETIAEEMIEKSISPSNGKMFYTAKESGDYLQIMIYESAAPKPQVALPSSEPSV